MYPFAIQSLKIPLKREEQTKASVVTQTLGQRKERGKGTGRPPVDPRTGLAVTPDEEMHVTAFYKNK